MKLFTKMTEALVFLCRKKLSKVRFVQETKYHTTQKINYF